MGTSAIPALGPVSNDPTFFPARYMSTMVLYCEGDEFAALVDGAPPGPNGRLFIVPSRKAVKVPWEAGRFILEHMDYTGVVRVEEEETEEGVKYLVSRAKERSIALLAEQDKLQFHRYVQDAVDDFVRHNKPVPQPSDRILRIIERRGYDLKKFGIKPIGWEEPEREKELKEAKQQNADLQTQLTAMQAQMELLTKQVALQGTGQDKLSTGSDAGDEAKGKGGRQKR